MSICLYNLYVHIVPCYVATTLRLTNCQCSLVPSEKKQSFDVPYAYMCTIDCHTTDAHTHTQTHTHTYTHTYTQTHKHTRETRCAQKHNVLAMSLQKHIFKNI
eukprot:GHVQ01007870.1.p2 GENE.GHVQ01007870.1~~GHVQ01007870.1.p2  ORF type:complete len:103 (-),score=14.26 GHVQ01007870.1:174-482(-)